MLQWEVFFANLAHLGRDNMATISQMTFQMPFLEWKCMNFNENFIDFSSEGFN